MLNTDNTSKLYLKRLWWLLLSFCLIVADQVTKIVAFANLADGHSLKVLPGLNFTLAFNQGAAFSFLSDAGGWQNVFFIILAIVITACLIICLLKNNSILQNLALSMIIAGALGNVVDRLHYGFVIDFIDVYIKHYHWPVFNLADSAISVGVIVLLIGYFIKKPK